jgi:hypothetical protein
MNRPLPAGDRGNRSAASSRAPGRTRAVLGAGGLGRGVAAIEGEPGIGPRCATFGPRSLGRRRVEVTAKATGTGAGRESGQKQKSPPRPKPGGQKGGVRCYELRRYVRSPPSGLKDSTW